MFGLFILSCGTTHLMAAWTVYYPSYWTEGVIKTVNAIISIITAVMIIPLMPKLLALPSIRKAYQEIDVLNQKLKTQVQELISENSRRKVAESQLQGSNMLLNAIIEGTTDAIFLKDLEGRYLLANKATLGAIGKSIEEVIGKEDREVFPSSSAKIINQVDSSVLESGKTLLVEERLETASGESIWLANKSPYRDEDGKIIGLIGISRNITDIKKSEEDKANLEMRLQHAEKMEAIGTLAGGIAHDFNNILGVIFGYTAMAMDNAPEKSELASDLEKVLEAANRAKELVKQILAFSRQTAIERIPMQLQSLVKETLKMLRSSLPTTIEIRDNIDSRCGVVLVDPTQVHQILMNLATNANHAMEKSGGVLTVELKRFDNVSRDHPAEIYLEPGEYVELVVTDTGSGIGPDVIDKIFDPYFTTKDFGKGTGMGLSIIHGIINSYGGCITVESRLGKGSSFHVFFPVIDQNALPVDKEDEDIPMGKGRVLFIDDEELLANLGQEMLTRLGYTVTVRHNSLEALNTFQNNPADFDVVITDQTMPGMTGADLARRMLQIRPDIPIILCTGYSNLIDEVSAKSFGIKEFAMKPLTKNGIAQLLRKVLVG
ncbi:MAG: response regulator [Proteobacteria bacterium]|nr:response regulator [Pseudomonadota bacterium]MBU1687366.1 response regulator [Pseudomonadota bacterium]